MRVDLFDFDLPEERIALRPASPREAARMLVVGSDLQDAHISDLPNLLRPGDALVVNDTRVLPARLYGLRLRGENAARCDVTLIKRESASVWRAFGRPAKKMQPGDLLRFGETSDNVACMLGQLNARVLARDEAEVTLEFEFAGAALDEALTRVGQMPLPPYIAGKRAEDAQDERDYQTIFAQEAGAVAAPTAGLHFTPGLRAAVEARGVSIHSVTLHVGAGTFLPVKVEDTADHKMHSEWGRVDAATVAALNEARARGGRIVAVGTTALRILESAAQSGALAPFEGETNIFITPGYRFKAVDVLMTNFHLPRSTLFMLVSAFAGLERMRRAYAHAIAQGYRFYSYGDACFLERAPG
jgi:S-adenosylmethionine:tRNA ribosyltransferase-isomerase